MQPFEPLRSLVAELKRRRVAQVVAIYGGLSFALLQGVEIVIDSLGLSPVLLTALTLFILFGFPIAIVVAWIYDIDSRGRLLRTLPIASTEATDSAEPVVDVELPRSFDWRMRTAGVAIGVVLVSASWFTATRILPVEYAEAVFDPRGSYLVSPISSRFQSQEDLETADRAARKLTRQLQGWETVRAVQSFALEGMLLRLGIGESEVPTLEQAFEMAETQGVGTLVAVKIEGTGDDIEFEAVLFDVSNRRAVGQTIVLTGSAADLDGLVAPVAQSILQLRDQAVSLNALRSESNNPAAHQDFEAGLDALHDWRLEEAEARFRKAITEDSLFASAHHYLALTLYWQTTRDTHRILDTGPEIARFTQAANRLAEVKEIRAGLRMHMAAFGAFWRGDYDEARIAYREILAKDRSDTEAWLLLGAVEVNDPMLYEVEPGRLIPRQNLNVARGAFSTAADLSPDWQISYGHLFSIDRELESAAKTLRCPGFERPGSPAPSPLERTRATDQVAFCPLVEDSIVWVQQSAVDRDRRRRAVAGAERLTLRSRSLLEDWTRIHPEQARPHDELADWLAWRRGTLGCKADATVVRDLTADILAEREASLTLRADTTLEDLVRMSVLRLAMDDVKRSVSLMDEALAGLEAGDPVPDETANVMLAMGMAERALEITKPTWSTWTFMIRDPEGDTPLAVGDVARPLMELRMYGATGPGPEIEQAFEELFTEWSTHDFSPTQEVYVRRFALRQGIGPALAMSLDARSRWFDGWDEAGVEVPALWRGFLAADAAAGSEERSVDLDEALEAVLNRLDGEGATRFSDHYLAALLAQLAGHDLQAIEQLILVDSCPMNLQTLSVDWGLRTLGRWHQAQSYLALEDSVRASIALASYAALRADGGLVRR